MEYISLDKLRNPYPLDSNSQNGNPNYKSNVGLISLLGKFESNKEDVIQQTSLSSIQVLDTSHTFRFILNIDGQLISSNQFLQDLQSAKNENNPYFTLENSPIVSFSLSELTTPHQDYTFGETYAESEVTKNINKGSTILKNVVDHIDWLAQKDNQQLRGYNEIGSWVLSTTPYDPSTDTGMKVELTEDVEQEKLRPSTETL